MAAETRVYKVTGVDGKFRLVRATHPSNARNFVTEKMFTVSVANGYDFEAAMAGGIKVEHIGQEQLQLDVTGGTQAYHKEHTK